MVIYYVHGQSFELDHLEWADGGSLPSQMSSSLPVLDASAYVSGVVPLPEKSGFLMSHLFENSGALLLDFQNAARMSNALDRLSYFVESNGQGKVPTLDEIQWKIMEVSTSCQNNDEPCGLAEGHDLKLKDIASFYSRCQSEGVKLTRGEEELLKKLIEQGFLQKGVQGDFSSTPGKVLMGMSRSHSSIDRREIFVHEYSHIQFFLDPSFKEAVSDVWHSLKPEEQRFLRGAMVACGWYASGGEDLLHTETQAHAIAPPFSGDGFIKVLWIADKNCVAKKASPKACEDFRSYRGKIRKFLSRLHDKYMEISADKIPLLGGLEKPSQTPSKNDQTVQEVLASLKEIKPIFSKPPLINTDLMKRMIEAEAKRLATRWPQEKWVGRGRASGPQIDLETETGVKEALGRLEKKLRSRRK